MAIYDKASLVLIPSGTKTSKVYSQVPTNGDGDFTFSRSTAATRVNASGNIEKETQNLLTHSGDLTNAVWIPTGLGYDGTETDPNGGSKAYSFISGSTNGYLRQNNTLSGGVYTFSVYLKSTTNISINIRLDSYNGTFENYPCALTTDWQRFEFFYVHNSSTLGAWIGGGLSWTTGEEVHIAFPQLEQGLVARDYIETTTTAIYGGITDNVPRLDYTDSSCPALLLEPQRTNLYNSSEYDCFDSGGTRMAATGNETAFCDAYDTPVPAAKVQNTGSLYFYDTTSPSATTAHTWSAFFRLPDTNNLGTSRIRVNTTNTFASSETRFDLVNGTILTTNAEDATITSFPNNWYRLSVTKTATSTGGGFNFLVYVQDSLGNDLIADAGDVGDDVIHTFGWQFEEGSYATSYIPTYGSAVTRNADACNGALSVNDINSQEGVLYAEISALYNVGNFELISLNDGSNDNRCSIFFNGGTLSTSYRVNQSNIFLNINSSFDILQYHKVAISYKQNEFKAFVDGVKVAEQLSGNVAPANTFNELSFDRGGSSSNFIGKTKQILTFNTALSDEELAALTTI